jgi:hypothetical protein
MCCRYGFRRLRALTAMSLTANRLGPTVLKTLADVLGRRASLTKLDLSHNQFDESGFAGGEARDTGLAVGDAPKKNGTLTSLNLTAGGEALALPLDETGGLWVARALAVSPNATCVNLGGNLLTPEVALDWKSLNLEDNALGRAGLNPHV